MTAKTTHYQSFTPQSTNIGGYRYFFNGQEGDNEVFGEVANFGYEFRPYDSRIGRWWGVDPKWNEYPGVSPFVFCNDSPVMLMDPNGEEGITVSGSPGNHTNKKHFLINGLNRAKQAQAHFQRGNEQSTWIIYNDRKNGFPSDMLNSYIKKAKEAKINVVVVSDVREITNYINNKLGGDSRKNDQITSFYYVGHATPGDLDVGYKGTGQDFDPSDLSADAFSKGTYVDVVGGCRTAIDWGIGLFDKSIIKQFADILDETSEIHGSNVKVQYDGGVRSNKQLLEHNKGEEIIIKGNNKSGK